MLNFLQSTRLDTFLLFYLQPGYKSPLITIHSSDVSIIQYYDSHIWDFILFYNLFFYINLWCISKPNTRKKIDQQLKHIIEISNYCNFLSLLKFHF